MKKIYPNITINQEQNRIVDKKKTSYNLSEPNKLHIFMFFRLIKLNRFYYTSLGYVKK